MMDGWSSKPSACRCQSWLLPRKIWRRMFESELKLAEDGLKFMKAQVAKYC
jgi:hypothetical protein